MQLLNERLGSMRRRLKPLAHRYLLAGPVQPLALYIARHIFPVDPETGQTLERAPNILTLSPSKFRKDLQILANTCRLRIHAIEPDFQRSIVSRFRLCDGSFHDYCAADPDPSFAASRERALHIWRRVLPAVFRRFQIQAVLGAAVHYQSDWDIGTAAEWIGVPYIVLHRENSFVAAPGTKQQVMDRMRRAHPFTGSKIIMHNEQARQCLIETGFVEPERVTCIGCLRMDEWVRWCDRDSTIGREAVLFSFSYASGFIGRENYATDGQFGFVDLFHQTHIAFAELAKANPAFRFVVKTKYGQADLQAIRRVLANAGIDSDAIPNYRITLNDDAHDLIRRSAVVISFQSTTMLEAALAARPVVVPFFAEAMRADYRQYLRFQDAYDLFLIAESVEKMKWLVRERLENPRRAAERMPEKRRLFEATVSKLGEQVVPQYVEALRDTARWAPMAEQRESR